ncbi:UbiX family flavin prenyltransferase [Desulfurispira natronophila]|uniref:4-hydroxy-3-polyprenylbenzoate decarboxylase n=1 Tax=Desulfurispira natronophila TaxID=682562 RepID=A0A7W7Y471_9BACT|nr:UbiX family flavin prenyltransferase [Desulfurispira natronophila]MBB5021786.1 4-hydroxy-3-polyprenylbenzoate decarboxylase [Desulfurispira natronophila]
MNCNIAVVVTGATGSNLAIKFLQLLQEQEISSDVVFSHQGMANLALEYGYSVAEIPQMDTQELSQVVRQHVPSQCRIHDASHFFSPLASGSGAPMALVVLPASMGYCARVAQGSSETLAERVFDVCLKEQRPILVCPRESPLSQVHLRNLLELSTMGVQIVPFMPEFYSHQRGSMDKQIDRFVSRLAGMLQVNAHYSRWMDGSEAP